ncbi:MAG: ribonuclease J, partial [Chloroflexi bacterium]|nr:ribonuclease J [Chloroflexota bacterium]
GEYRHLIAHCRLAQDMGITPENTFALEDGDVLELGEDEGRIVGQAPAGHIYVDGLQLWDPESIVLRDRRTLSRDGIVVVIVTVDKATGQVLKAPEMVASGFVEPEGYPDLMERAAKAALKAVDHKGSGHPSDLSYLTAAVKESVSNFLYHETHQRPLIISVPVEV